MNAFFRFVTGSFRLTYSSSEPEAYLEALHRMNVPLWGIRKQEDSLSFSLSPRHLHLAKALVPKGKESGLETKAEGILVWWERFGKRLGLFVGLALFCTLSLLSTLFVWSVEVEGNALFSDREIRARLSEMGLRPGVLLSRVDTRNFSLAFQVENKEFSHASLNLIGTRAILTVREREQKEMREEETGDANLVAAIHGKILRYEVLAGQTAVKRGDLVQKGDLLISGVVERSNGAFTTTRARGRVLAQTERSFSVTIPLEEVESVFTGRENEKRSYQILGLSLASPLFDTSPYESFSTVETQEEVTLFGRTLPILCITRRYLEKEEKSQRLTVDRAEDLAYDKYEEYKGENLLPGYEILAEDFHFSCTEDSVTLEVSLVLIEDIARCSPFSCVESSITERTQYGGTNH